MKPVDDCKYAALFKALSDPNRVMIVRMLAGGDMCACHMLEMLEISQPTLSHHMKALCASGLIKPRRAGKWMHYSLNKEALQPLRLFLEEAAAIG